MEITMKRVMMAAVAVSLLSPAMVSYADPAATPAPGQPGYAKTHPRVHQVNKRLRNQNKRINKDVKNGKLTTQQAQQLKTNDQAINQQKKADMAADGGHLTKADQRQLNQEQNANSTMIKDEAHPAGQ